MGVDIFTLLVNRTIQSLQIQNSLDGCFSRVRIQIELIIQFGSIMIEIPNLTFDSVVLDPIATSLLTLLE